MFQTPFTQSLPTDRFTSLYSDRYLGQNGWSTGFFLQDAPLQKKKSLCARLLLG
jgi:hypothetical protein